MHALIRWPNSVFAYPFVDAIQCTQKDCKNKCGINIQQSFYLLNGCAICAFSQQCVVPENIYTLPTLEGHGNSEGLGGGVWKRYISEGERCTERVFYPLSIRWYIVTGLLIFRAVAELRISSKSAKSREIHLKTCKMSKVLARSHEITNKPLRVRTTKTLWLPTWKTNCNAEKCASDVKKKWRIVINRISKVRQTTCNWIKKILDEATRIVNVFLISWFFYLFLYNKLTWKVRFHIAEWS